MERAECDNVGFHVNHASSPVSVRAAGIWPRKRGVVGGVGGSVAVATHVPRGDRGKSLHSAAADRVVTGSTSTGAVDVTPSHVIPHDASLLEVSLSCLLRMDEQLLPPEAVATVEAALACVNDAREQPNGSSTIQCTLPHGSGDGDADFAVCRQLASACHAPSTEAALDALLSFYHNHADRSVPSLSLIAAAAAEALLHQAGDERDVQEALRLCERAISDGHPAAMLRVGLCLMFGRGVPPDVDTGLMWVKHAASVGYAPAMHELGELYESGVTNSSGTVEADWGEAMYWYRAAARKGYHPAQLNLAKLLLTASEAGAAQSVVSSNEQGGLKTMAKEWLEHATIAGNAEAAFLLDRLRV